MAHIVNSSRNDIWILEIFGPWRIGVAIPDYKSPWACDSFLYTIPHTVTPCKRLKATYTDGYAKLLPRLWLLPVVCRGNCSVMNWFTMNLLDIYGTSERSVTNRQSEAIDQLPKTCLIIDTHGCYLLLRQLLRNELVHHELAWFPRGIDSTATCLIMVTQGLRWVGKSTDNETSVSYWALSTASVCVTVVAENTDFEEPLIEALLAWIITNHRWLVNDDIEDCDCTRVC